MEPTPEEDLALVRKIRELRTQIRLSKDRRQQAQTVVDAERLRADELADEVNKLVARLVQPL